MRIILQTVLAVALALSVSACGDKTKTEKTDKTAETKPESSDSGKTAAKQDSTELAEKEEVPAEVVANVKVGSDKIGYLNSQELLAVYPEAQAIEKKLTEIAKAKQTELEGMANSAQSKFEAYQKNAQLLNEEERATREKELMGLQQQLQDADYKAQDALERERQKMLAPVLKKLDKVVKEVAKENGFTYVLDPSMGGLVYADSTRNLMPLVKERLGIKKKK